LIFDQEDSMPKIHAYNVVPVVPEPLQPLRDLAYNLIWSWDPDLFQLFRRVDEDLFEETNNNPAKLLSAVRQERLDELSQDDGFLHHMGQLHDRFRRYMTQKTWHSRRYGHAEGVQVAYFAAEFGLARCLRLYSGGLGILSGDHLKSSSDLGIPLVGVGLLYQKGYFIQYLNADGWQQERYEANDVYNLPIELVRNEDGKPVVISVEYPGRDVFAQVWRVRVGRTALFLMDTNIPQNRPEDQDIGDYLYGGDREMRLKQELILGIGGVRTLTAMGLAPTVFHMNEGHSAFMALERIRQLMKQEKLSFSEARIACSAGNVFTTHTAVPAGFDLFSRELMERYLGPIVSAMGIDFEQFMAVGRGDPFDHDAPFNMALFAARNSNNINGVSMLHGEVTRKMFHAIMPDVPVHEVPIGSITNGIHSRTWVAPEVSSLYDRYLGERWVEDPSDPQVWQRVFDIPDAELWRVHERRRARLVSFSRRLLREQLETRGFSRVDTAVADEVLDPEILTIGFARRFATYKRAALLLKDRDRLKRILCSPERPVQIVFAGKAHPLDEPGKQLIQEIVEFSEDPMVRRRMVFLENYDMEIARFLVGGVDVWMNSPQRPLEASGTSGMKAVYNGALNFSILDGWWDEAYDPGVGWAIGGGEEYTDPEYRDEVESRSVYHTLERDIVPVFYDRDVNGLPRKWIMMMKNALAGLGPMLNTARMVREYHEKYYRPATQAFRRLAADGYAMAREQAIWMEQIYKHWKAARVEQVRVLDPVENRPVGSEIEVEARVRLGEIRSDQVVAEAYAGVLNGAHEIPRGKPYRLAWEREVEPGVHLFRGKIACETSGRHGFLCRIRPEMEGAPRLLGLIRWE
jgi:starch phosphorylase